VKRVRACSAWMLSATLAGCSASSIHLNRDYDDPADAAEQYQAQSPEAFTERFGEPDEWKKSDKDDKGDPQMTATWKCLDGKRREITWRMQESQKGVRRWVVVSDTSRKGDCDKAGTK